MPPRGGTYVSDEERARIISLKQENWSYEDIAKEIGRSLPTVRRVWSRFKKFGEIKRENKARFHFATTDEQDQQILAQIRNDPTHTAASIKANLNLNVSSRTIRRRLKEAGMEWVRPQKKDKLNQDQILTPWVTNGEKRKGHYEMVKLPSFPLRRRGPNDQNETNTEIKNTPTKGRKKEKKNTKNTSKEKVKDEPEPEDPLYSLHCLKLQTGYLSDWERNLIVNLRKQKWTYKAIAEEIGRSVISVRRVWGRFKKEGTYKRPIKRKFHSATTADEDKRIIAAILQDPSGTAATVKDLLGLKASKRTIRRRLKDAGLFWHRNSKNVSEKVQKGNYQYGNPPPTNPVKKKPKTKKVEPPQPMEQMIQPPPPQPIHQQPMQPTLPPPLPVQQHQTHPPISHAPPPIPPVSHPPHHHPPPPLPPQHNPTPVEYNGYMPPVVPHPPRTWQGPNYSSEYPTIHYLTEFDWQY